MSADIQINMPNNGQNGQGESKKVEDTQVDATDYVIDGATSDTNVLKKILSILQHQNMVFYYLQLS